jgi:hypothetical protein
VNAAVGPAPALTIEDEVMFTVPVKSVYVRPAESSAVTFTGNDTPAV